MLRMMIVTVMELYAWIESLSDKRVESWFLVANPIPVFVILTIYMAFVYFIGPRFMAERKPYEFKLILPLYNFAVVCLNFHIVKEILSASSDAKYSYVCAPLKRDSYDPNEMRIASALWLYYISKYLDLFDTVFFVLRKKTRQITFLHIFHHFSMPLWWWMGVKLAPGGQSFFYAMINSAVHVLVYAYYGLAALGPHMQKYLWWKRYLTVVQLVQFSFSIIHAAVGISDGCDFPHFLSWAVLIDCSIFFVLFINFYVQSYIKRKHHND